MINRLLHALHLVGFGAIPTMILDDQNEWHSRGCCPKTWFCKCTMKSFAYWMFYSEDLGSEWYFQDIFFSSHNGFWTTVSVLISELTAQCIVTRQEIQLKISRYNPWMCSDTISLLLFQPCVKNVYLQTVFLIIGEKGWLRWKNPGEGYEV